MFGGSNITTIKPDERRQHVPSDVLSLAQYADFKKRHNDSVPEENERIKVENARLKAHNQPLKPELEPHPLDTVLMISERAFIMTRPDFKRILIPRGIFNCPVELANDWYIRANGVIAYVHPDRAPVEEKPIKNSPLKNISSKSKA